MDKKLENFFMEESIKQMLLSTTEVKVGAILVIDNEIVSSGFKDRKNHAERVAIDSALENGFNLNNAILFTTLEPCVETKVDQKVTCCSDYIIESGIKKVYIGSYDKNPNIYRKGWKRLRDNGVTLKDYPDNLIAQIKEYNGVFEGYFTKGVGPTGSAKVFHKDKAKFEIQLSPTDTRTIEIQWNVCGRKSAYIYAIQPNEVANPLFAHEFSEVDNPNAFEFSYTVEVAENEIGIYKCPAAYVLVKPKTIKSGPDHGDSEFFVIFSYEVRVK